MEPMSRTERAALCNTALEAGAEAPTLCGDWTVRELVVHLLVRERDPLGAPGIVVPQLEGLTARASARLRDQDFTVLVERVRTGPPAWSPLRIPPIERVVNTLEYFVHHEDIRRAQPGWEPRELTARQQAVLFKAIGVAGKGLVRRAGVPVSLRTPEGRTTELRKASAGEQPVVVTGEPAELVLYCFGRGDVGRVELDGPQAQVARLRGAHLGP